MARHGGEADRKDQIEQPDQQIDPGYARAIAEGEGRGRGADDRGQRRGRRHDEKDDMRGSDGIAGKARAMRGARGCGLRHDGFVSLKGPQLLGAAWQSLHMK